MNQEEINKQIFERLEKLEKVAFGSEKIAEKLTKTVKAKNKTEDLKASVMKLFNSGFFKEVKIDMEVLAELQKRLLTRQKPLRPSVVNVLRGMVKKELLERIEVVHGKDKLFGYKNKS